MAPVQLAGWWSCTFNVNGYVNLLGRKLAAKWDVCTPSYVFC